MHNGTWLSYDGSTMVSITVYSSVFVDARRLISVDWPASNGVLHVIAQPLKNFFLPVPAFLDVAYAAGLPIWGAIGKQSPPLAAGLAVGDCDSDGDPDLFLPNVGADSALYVNRGGDFVLRPPKDSGIKATLRGSTAAFADVDNDGLLDLYVVTSGDVRHYLYINVGNCRFVEDAESRGVDLKQATPLFSYSVTFGDFDLDGDLDLFVGQWTDLFIASATRVFRNDGYGRFEEITELFGLIQPLPDAVLGTAVVDLNGDHYPEIVWVGSYGKTVVYWNRRDGSLEKGQSYTTNYFDSGTTFFDLNGDGLIDIFSSGVGRESVPGNVNASAGNKLYLNRGNGCFAEAQEEWGCVGAGWGWGAAALDFENDGDTDLVSTTGDWIAGIPSLGVNYNQLWQNMGAPPFRADSNRTLLPNGEGLQGRGIATLDYDNDGAMDFLVAYNNLGKAQPGYSLYEQLLAGAASWIKLRFQGTKTNAFGLGVEVALYPRAAMTPPQWKVLTTNGVFMGQSEYVLHFGLASETLVDFDVYWPVSRRKIRYRGKTVNQTLTISEDDACQGTTCTERTGCVQRFCFAEEAGDGCCVEEQVCSPAHRVGVCEDWDNTKRKRLSSLPSYTCVNPSPIFRNVAVAAGLPWGYNMAYSVGRLAPPMLGGAAVGDYNGDGRPDIYLSSWISGDKLLKNNGDGTFEDVTVAAGILDILSTAAAFADVDNDGDLDLYVGTLATHVKRTALFINENGKFSEPAGRTSGATSFVADAHIYSVNFADYDLDGCLDLFLGQWRSGAGMQLSSVFRNLCAAQAGKFENVTEPLGMLPLAPGLDKDYTFGAAVQDLTGDHRPDVFWVRDFGLSALYLSTEAGLVRSPQFDPFLHSGNTNDKGCTVFDYDNDGDLDIFTVGILGQFDQTKQGCCQTYGHTGNRMYENLGNGCFRPVNDELALTDSGWGWGAVSIDVGNDGWTDLAVTNGPWALWLPGSSVNRNQLFINPGTTAPWAEVGLEMDFASNGISDGRGLAVLDFNNDGFMDILGVFNNGVGLGQFGLWLQEPNQHSWLKIRLVGVISNRWGLGAEVTVFPTTTALPTQFKVLGQNGIYMMSSEYLLHFGLGAETTVDISVYWPVSRRRIGYLGMAVNQLLLLREDDSCVAVECPPAVDCLGSYCCGVKGTPGACAQEELCRAWAAPGSCLGDTQHARPSAACTAAQTFSVQVLPPFAHSLPSVTDVTGDSLPDLFFPGSPCRLLQNKNGRQFVDISTAAGLAEAQAALSAEIDYNLDGKPDLLAGSTSFSIFRNNWPEPFTALPMFSGTEKVGDFLYADGCPDVALGFEVPSSGHPSVLVGAALTPAADFNADGSVDLLVTGAQSVILFSANDTLGTALELGLAVSSVAYLDIDSDGHAEFLLSGEEGAVLLRTLGAGCTTATAVDLPGDHVLFDLANRGLSLLAHLDGGEVVLRPTNGSSTGTGVRLAGATQLLAADFDRDGDLDLYLGSGSEHAVVLQAAASHWLEVRLVASATTAAAAVVSVVAGGAPGTLRQQQVYRSSPLRFGVSRSLEVNVTVYWPYSRRHIDYTRVALRTRLVLYESDACGSTTCESYERCVQSQCWGTNGTSLDCCTGLLTCLPCGDCPAEASWPAECTTPALPDCPAPWAGHVAFLVVGLALLAAGGAAAFSMSGWGAPAGRWLGTAVRRLAPQHQAHLRLKEIELE